MDYRSKRTCLNPVSISGTEDIVDDFKYLGVHIDKLERYINIGAVLSVFPEETQIFQCLKKHAADAPSLCGVLHHRQCFMGAWTSGWRQMTEWALQEGFLSWEWNWKL